MEHIVYHLRLQRGIRFDGNMARPLPLPLQSQNDSDNVVFPGT